MATATFRAADADHDRRIARAEWSELNRREIARSGEVNITANAGLLLHAMDDAFLRQDADGDGYLLLDELLAEPLALFDCIDADDDGQITRQEEREAVPRCDPADEEEPS